MRRVALDRRGGRVVKEAEELAEDAVSIIIQIIFHPSKFVFPGPSWPRLCAKSAGEWDAPESRKLCN
jgi:hypothetical protein